WGELLAAERDGQENKALRRRCLEPLHALFESIEKPEELDKPSFEFRWHKGVVTRIQWATFEGSEPLYELLLRLPCAALASELWLGDGAYDDWMQISELTDDTAVIQAHGLPPAVTKLSFNLSTLINNNGDTMMGDPPDLRPIRSRLTNIRE